MAERARVAIFVSALVAVLIGPTSPAVGTIVVPDPARPVIAMAQTTDLCASRSARTASSSSRTGPAAGPRSTAATSSVERVS
jgi:hypothetical protein